MLMKSLTLHAPAKLNLNLKVKGKRADGFHEIDTLMVPLPGLCDRLTFTPSEDFSFSCNSDDLPANEENLVVKAVRAFEKATAISCSYSIELTKSIPHGAGLGGGSSDAATTLMGLNSLNAAPLTLDRLKEIAGSLGSDVPFFLQSLPSRCTGRGEVVKIVADLPPLRVLLVKPDFAVSTLDAYKGWQSSVEIPDISYTAQEIGGLTLINDLERPVFQKYRFLGEVKNWLGQQNGVMAAMMSGSGSTMFAILQNDRVATNLIAAAQQDLDPNLWFWEGNIGNFQLP